MKANELRIGNLVSYRGKKEGIVSNLGNTFETIRDFNYLPYGSDDINEYEPIPLTKEWLVKFGFKVAEFESFKLKIKGFTIMVDILGDIIDCYLESIGTDIHYVHQLQNLYFALTNEELTINDSTPNSEL